MNVKKDNIKCLWEADKCEGELQKEMNVQKLARYSQKGFRIFDVRYDHNTGPNMPNSKVLE